MMKVVSKILTITACLTLLMNAMLPVMLWGTHATNTTRDRTDPYFHDAYVQYMGLEFTTFSSKDTTAIVVIALWTTLLALGYLFRDHFPNKQAGQLNVKSNTR